MAYVPPSFSASQSILKPIVNAAPVELPTIQVVPQATPSDGSVIPPCLESIFCQELEIA